MTRRKLFGLSLAPLFAPLLAWLPGRREPGDSIRVYRTGCETAITADAAGKYVWRFVEFTPDV